MYGCKAICIFIAHFQANFSTLYHPGIFVQVIANKFDESVNKTLLWKEISVNIFQIKHQ